MHRFQGRATQEVMVGNRGGIEPEDLERLDDHDDSGDDGGRAVGVQAPDRTPLRLGHAGQAFEDAAAGRERHHMAVHGVAE